MITVIANLVYLAALLVPGDPASTLVNVWLSLAVRWIPVGVFGLVAVRTRFARWEVGGDPRRGCDDRPPPATTRR